MSKSAMKSLAICTAAVVLAGLLMNQLGDVPGIREAKRGFNGQ